MSTTGRLFTSAVLFLLFSSFLKSAESKWVEGTIETYEDWVFITRFCFLSNVGNMKYLFEYPYEYGIENILFYYDVPGQWDAVYQKDLTCDKKMDALRGNNRFPLGAPGGMYRYFGNSLQMCNDSVIRAGRRWYVCQGDMDFSSARERWWFIVLSRCDPPANNTVRGMYLRYKLHMTNGDDLLHKEFSADEFYILIIDIIFFILYLILMVLSIICAMMLSKKQLLHTTYKMYMATLTIWTLHLFCMVIAWGYYGTTGWEIRPLEVVGRILQACGHIIFMLMLILMAKGYTIVRGRLTKKNAIKITIFINLYIVATIILFIWEGVIFDPGLVLYYYESPPGYGMITVILIGWLWFTKAAVFTLKYYKTKTTFYVAFYSIYTIWFWASPIVTLVAMFAMAKWTREKSVNGVQQFIALVGHSVFLLLTWPSRVDDNFPYTIRTTQIAAMKDSEDSGSQSDNTYVISSEYTTGPNLDIFITLKDSDQSAGGDRVYGPLGSKIFQSEDTGTPDHAKPQFGSSLPPIRAQLSHGTPTTSAAANSTTQNGHSSGSLPPLRTATLHMALHGDEDGDNSIQLPPLRGTGLPPIVAHGGDQPTNTKDLFTVSSKASNI
ncbi:unnamed protein product [Lymnaea stagnalis]|uniref:Intimal thickness related receptor IRP domain-containing protein n=1 Tax=Lymnaea stagnalis TaxID=6523 RepID=A0AAV2HRB0_LYMST